MYKLNDKVMINQKPTNVEVECNTVNAAVYGKTGKVIKIDFDGYILVKFKKQWHSMLHHGGKIKQGSGNCWYFPPNRLKLKDKITIGSKVVVTNDHIDPTIGNILVGKGGTVTNKFSHGDKKWLTIKFKENHGHELHNGDINGNENVYWHIRPKFLKLVK